MRRRGLIWACRIAIAGIFLAAGIPKILDPHGFAVAVYRYQMLPPFAVNLVAIYLPWLEVLAAFAILWPKTARGSAGILVLLLAVFTVAIAANLVRGIDISCGCFSVAEGSARIGWEEVVRDLAFLALAIIAALDPAPRRRG